ncbi:MAG: hypothetical protein ACPLPW_02660 [bacterium]
MYFYENNERSIERTIEYVEGRDPVVNIPTVPDETTDPSKVGVRSPTILKSLTGLKTFRTSGEKRKPFLLRKGF